MNNVTVKHLGQRTWDLISDKKYSIKIRARQKSCSDEEWTKLLEIAESKEKPQHYFAVMTAKTRWDKTLEFVRKALKVAKNAGQIVYKLAKYMPNIDVKFKNYIIFKMSEYSEFHQMEILGRCKDKREPQRYLIGILKKGFQPAKMIARAN